MEKLENDKISEKILHMYYYSHFNLFYSTPIGMCLQIPATNRKWSNVICKAQWRDALQVARILAYG